LYSAYKSTVTRRLHLLGVPETRQSISAVSGRSSPYCGNIWRRYCCSRSYLRLSIYALVAKTIDRQNSAMVRHFCVL